VKTEARKVQTTVTLGALFVALAHVIWPSVTIDTITVALIVIAILPWLAPLLKTLELPGGVKIEFQDLQEAKEKAQDAGLLSSKPSSQDKEKYAFQVVQEADPNLALAGLRIEIERRLQKLAELQHIRVSRPDIGGLVSALRNTNTFSINEEAVLRDLASLLNAAVHGASVDSRAVQWASEVGIPLLATFDERIARFAAG
jgi:hypothetical protein